MEDLIEKGRVVRGWLGVLIQNVDESLAEAMDLSTTEGALVSQVVKDGPAEVAGLKRGDVIVEVDGKRIKNTLELRNTIAETSPGTTVDLSVIRDGKTKRIGVELGELPDQEEARQMTRTTSDRLGLEVGPLTERLAERLGYEGETGVLVTRVAPHSAADRAGLQENDLIVEIDKKEIESVDEYEEVLEDINPGETLLLLVRRSDASFFLPLKLPRE
jgi:serine protease Do